MEKFEGIGALARRGTSTDMNVAPLPIRNMPLKVGAPMMHETCNTTPPACLSPPTAAAERPISQTAFDNLTTSGQKDFATSSEMRVTFVQTNVIVCILGNTKRGVSY